MHSDTLGHAGPESEWDAVGGEGDGFTFLAAYSKFLGWEWEVKTDFHFSNISKKYNIKYKNFCFSILFDVFRKGFRMRIG